VNVHYIQENIRPKYLVNKNVKHMTK